MPTLHILMAFTTVAHPLKSTAWQPLEAVSDQAHTETDAHHPSKAAQDWEGSRDREQGRTGRATGARKGAGLAAAVPTES